MAGEDARGPADARVRLERQSTQSRQHARPAATAQLIPTEVSGQGHDSDRAEHQRDADPPMGSEGADAQERRHGGERDAKLLGDDQGRQDHDGVLLEDLKAVSRAHTPPGRTRSTRYRRVWDGQPPARDSRRRAFSSGRATTTASHASKEYATRCRIHRQDHAGSAYITGETMLVTGGLR